MAGTALQPIGRLNYAQGARLGLPRQPRPGQAVKDTATGIYYVWHDEPGALGDLGFWQALVGMGVSLIGSLFGGPRPDKAAREQLQAQQGQLNAIQQQLDAQSFFNPKTVFLLAIFGLAVVMAFRK